MNYQHEALDCYIAGPWFTPEQDEIIENIKMILKSNDQTFFSPKDDCLFDPQTMTPKEVLDTNIDALNMCDYVVCVTDGRDAGTLFEAGWSFANNIPIIYLWLGGKPEDKFNLVLAASGAVCRSYEHLEQAIDDRIWTGEVEIKTYGESLSYE